MRLNSIWIWARQYSNNPLPWSFQGYQQQQLGWFTLFLRSNHPADTTPTMESWSRSSRRDKLVLWSQEYFRLMESWRFLKNDSRSRASLKNCGERRGTSCATDHNTSMLTGKEKIGAELPGTDDTPGLVMLYHKVHRRRNWGPKMLHPGNISDNNHKAYGTL